MTDDSWGLIKEALKNASIESPEPDVRERFDVYLELLDRWNPVSGLTTVYGETERVIKHLCDSLALLPALDDCLGADGPAPIGGHRVADVGTGAGFPALPCAIARSDVSWWLVDKDSLKRRFLEAAVSALGISAAVVSRLEDCFDDDYASAPTVRVARALAAPVRALELCSPTSLPGPESLLLMLGPSAQSEISRISFAAEQRSLRLDDRMRYDLPRGAGARLILCFSHIVP